MLLNIRSTTRTKIAIYHHGMFTHSNHVFNQPGGMYSHTV